ncbi:PPC domain-containing DNA-binding protein [Fibrobacterota bacterium]
MIRLENGDILNQCIENFAVKHHLSAASLAFVGGVDKGSRLIVGPEDGEALPVTPMEHRLAEAHEAFGTGTIFSDEQGRPVLHMHISCGRGRHAITGCVRLGVKIWHIGEVILEEITDTSAVRRADVRTGFNLLEP